MRAVGTEGTRGEVECICNCRGSERVSGWVGDCMANGSGRMGCGRVIVHPILDQPTKAP